MKTIIYTRGEKMSKKYWNEREEDTIRKLNIVLDGLPDFVSRYTTYIADTTAALTRYNYAKDIEMFFDYVAKELGISISDITTDTLSSLSVDFLSEYSNYMAANYRGNTIHKTSKVTRARRLSSLRSLYKYLYSTDQISQNQMSKVRNPKIDEQEIIALTSDEATTLLNSTMSTDLKSEQAKHYNELQQFRDYTILSVLVNTGIRVSELVGLDIKDIDTRNASLRVIRKGHSEYSTLFYNDDLANLLEDYIDYRTNILGVAEEDEDALFLSSRKKRIAVRSVQELVKKYTNRSGLLKHVTVHKLRSTYGTLLYKATGDIKLTADSMGHKSIETTSRRYVNSGAEERRAAKDIININ